MSDSSSILGRTVSHYRVLEKLGAGGMGEVYRAHDERLDRDVAIKILPPSGRDNQDAGNRLLEEARSASQLNHSHICTVYEVGEENGVAFIAMEFIAGSSLSAINPSGWPGNIYNGSRWNISTVVVRVSIYQTPPNERVWIPVSTPCSHSEWPLPPNTKASQVRDYSLRVNLSPLSVGKFRETAGLELAQSDNWGCQILAATGVRQAKG